MDAAKRVGKRAFWVDFECVRNDDGVARSTSSSEDVYRICDIVRAAHSMIIAIGPSASDKVAALIDGCEAPVYRREELLLCPAEYRINLYVLGDPTEPKAMAKRNSAERAWEDAEAVKELVDHFEGSAILTELRLIEAALFCFSRRQTDQFSQGDIAYATMGLFPNRHRPQVNKEGSGFQAFAKLSLANDSGAFLSRLICLAPQHGAPWYQTDDRLGVKLSDIYPSCNVSGVVGSEAIILDGVHGATIHWDSIDPEPLFGQNAKFVLPWFVVSHLVSFAFPMMSLAMIYLLTSIGSAMGSRFPKEGSGFFCHHLHVEDSCGWSLCHVILSDSHLFAVSAKPPLKSRLIGLEGSVTTGKIAEYLWGFDHGALMTVIPQSYSDTEDLGPSPTPLLSSTRQEEHGFTLVE
ncbi:3-hydroxyisobutyrate dehydrogenase protein [Colletotrichum incanum]|uniref:3-hydroxyisobutyrate dehydrogenase protein n=1 Tax=Colletotrichum incanum TaxID=1573173 RepID=A0A167DZB3_COLIC|nr:3-hydroxyisobutyrate dehydrogenase protein [Colletotrichum incanum]